MSDAIDRNELFRLSREEGQGDYTVPEKTRYEQLVEINTTLAERMCECLGLDAGLVTSLTIKFKGGEIPTVTCEMLPTMALVNEDMKATLKEYVLVPIGAIVEGERLTGAQ